MIATVLVGLAATILLSIPTLAAALVGPSSADELEAPLHRVAYGLCWGLGLTPFLAFSITLFARVPLSPVLVASSAAAVTLGHVAVWLARGRKRPESLLRGWRSSGPVLLVCALVGLVYFAKFDSLLDHPHSCINEAVVSALNIDQPNEPMVDILRSHEQNQRLGTTAVVSSFAALYRGLGNRVLYGGLGLFMALGGFLLGVRLLGGRRWGWFVALVLPLNPYVFGLPFIDENLLFLSYSTLFLPLLFRARVPWATVGAMFGLVLMIRHIGVLSGPAILWATFAFSKRRLRAFLIAFAAFNLVTLVGHIHHVAAMGGLFRLENSGQFPIPHNIIGSYPGLLQWPFADQLARTPWNPLPLFLMWPVYLVDHLGLVLFCASLMGAVALIREHSARGLFWVLWFGLSFLGLSVQENWDYTNKMGVILMLFTPLIVWSGAGLRSVARSPARAGGILAVLVVATWVGVSGLGRFDVEPDERYMEEYPFTRPESEEWVRAERERVTSVAPWPDFGLIDRPAPFFRRAKLDELLRDLADPEAAFFHTPDRGSLSGRPVAVDGSPVEIALDLSRSLFDRSDWIGRVPPDAVGTSVDGDAALPAGLTHIDVDGDGEPDLLHVDLTLPEAGAVVITDLELPWTTVSGTMVMSRGRSNTSLFHLFFDPWRWSHQTTPGENPDLEPLIIEGRIDVDFRTARVVSSMGMRLRVRLPAGPLAVIEELNMRVNKYLLWTATVEAGTEPRVAGPFLPIHN